MDFVQEIADSVYLDELSSTLSDLNWNQLIDKLEGDPLAFDITEHPIQDWIADPYRRSCYSVDMRPILSCLHNNGMLERYLPTVRIAPEVMESLKFESTDLDPKYAEFFIRRVRDETPIFFMTKYPKLLLIIQLGMDSVG